MKLTDRYIRKIVPPPAERGPRDIPDAGVTGLCLTVRPSGVMTWTYRYRVGTVGKRYTIGRYPDVGIARARKRARELFLQTTEGIDPQAEKAAVRSGEVTDAFPDQAIRFIETYARPKNRSWLAQARLLGLSLNWQARRNPELDRHWSVIPGSPAERWQKRAVGTITRREVNEAVGAATERGGIAANRVHATLTRFFGWLVEQGVIETSPTIGTKAPTPERSRDRVLSGDELAAVWWAAHALGHPFGTCVQMMVLTGARRGEVAGMANCELADGVWTIPAARAKNGEEHELPLPESALEIITNIGANKSGLLFTTNDKTAISGWSKAKRQLDAEVARLANGRTLKPWTLHDIRRSVASGLAALGVEPHVIEAVLNHRSGTIRGVARVYNRHPYGPEKKDALERWAVHVAIKNFSF